jgi:hypothetical protein
LTIAINNRLRLRTRQRCLDVGWFHSLPSFRVRVSRLVFKATLDPRR